MDKQLQIETERVDDIPLIIGMAEAIGLAEVLDRHLGNHGHQAGLSNGQLAALWLSYILSEGDHRKCALQSWIANRRSMLGRLMGQTMGDAEGNDDRLGRLLRRLSRDEAWTAIEADLWRQTAVVVGLADGTVERVRLDSTTSYGYHQPTEDGLMQLGHSKDHRPDLAQFKLMAAVAEPARQMIAMDIVPGHRSDDGLYVPVIDRVRTIISERGLLYIGDAKMAAKATRGAIVAGGDHYLTVLPKSGWTGEVAEWLKAAQSAKRPRLAHERQLEVTIDGHVHRWTERVLLYRSDALVERRNAALDAGLVEAEAAIRALTPAPGPGRRQISSPTALAKAIQRIEQRHDMAGLLWVTWRSEAHPSRDDADRKRLVVKDVLRQDAVIDARRRSFGWRVLVTDAPAIKLSAEQAHDLYNQGWVIERQFYDLKDRPLGIQPLNVGRDDQIVGLTRLLILALRILTLIQVKAQRAIAASGEPLAGLYEGQPKRTTDRPSGRRILRAFYRAELTLTHIRDPNGPVRHLTPLGPLLTSIVTLLNLPADLYARLADLEPAL